MIRSSALLLTLLIPVGALAQTAPAKPPATPEAALKQQQKQAVKAQQGASPLGLGATNSKEPIKIDADRLDVFDKESKAIFAGNVVAVQGETTVRCSVMTIFYEPRGQQKGATPAAATPAPATAAARSPNSPPSSNDSSIKRVECDGPVTVLSKTQTATGDHATFDRAANKMIMTGNVALADGPNITRGEKLIYDTVTGVANVETTPGGRVKGLFIPGTAGQNTDAKPADGKAADAKPAEAKASDPKAAKPAPAKPQPAAPKPLTN